MIKLTKDSLSKYCSNTECFPFRKKIFMENLEKHSYSFKEIDKLYDATLPCLTEKECEAFYNLSEKYKNIQDFNEIFDIYELYDNFKYSENSEDEISTVDAESNHISINLSLNDLFTGFNTKIEDIKNELLSDDNFSDKFVYEFSNWYSGDITDRDNTCPEYLEKIIDSLSDSILLSIYLNLPTSKYILEFQDLLRKNIKGLLRTVILQYNLKEYLYILKLYNITKDIKEDNGSFFDGLSFNDTVKLILICILTEMHVEFMKLPETNSYTISDVKDLNTSSFEIIISRESLNLDENQGNIDYIKVLLTKIILKEMQATSTELFEKYKITSSVTVFV